MNKYRLCDGAPDEVVKAVMQEAEAIFKPVSGSHFNINLAEAFLLVHAVEIAAQVEPKSYRAMQTITQSALQAFVKRSGDVLRPDDQMKLEMLLKRFDWVDELNV